MPENSQPLDAANSTEQGLLSILRNFAKCVHLPALAAARIHRAVLLELSTYKSGGNQREIEVIFVQLHRCKGFGT